MEATFTTEPTPVKVFTDSAGVVHVELALHATRKESEEGVAWKCQYTRFHFSAKDRDMPTEADITSNPDAFIWFAGDLSALKGQYIQAAQDRMDVEAQSHGYDNIFTACSYANSKNDLYRAEAEACSDWRDAVWQYAHSFMAAVVRGERPFVPVDVFVAGLPEITWPESK